MKNLAGRAADVMWAKTLKDMIRRAVVVELVFEDPGQGKDLAVGGGPVDGPPRAVPFDGLDLHLHGLPELPLKQVTL